MSLIAEEFIPIEVIDFSQLPKPSRNKKQGEVQAQNDERNQADYEEQYKVLLERICQQLRQNNPALAEKTILKIKPPSMTRVSSKKIQWDNFSDTCKRMSRDPNHVLQFISTETGSECTITNNELVIKGRYSNKDMESLVKKYIHEFVKCTMCMSTNTKLIKDTNTRLYMLECSQCKCVKSVATMSKKKH